MAGNWVPQTQWAPAWVSWHEGGGYVGWAPLQPLSRFGRGGSIEVDVRVISPRAFVFVEERHFMSPVRPTTVVVNNTTIINKTVNITKIKVVNNTVINEGPRTTVIEQASGRKVQAVGVRELRHKEEAAVVAKQRTTPSVVERKIQTPVRTEAESREPRQVERPAATMTESQPPVTKKDTHQADEQKRAQQEKARAMENERSRPVPTRDKVKPEAERRAEAQEQKEQKAVEKRAEQQEKHEQAESEKARKKAAKEDHKKKGEEQQAPPEDPAVSPQSSQ